MTSLWLFGHVAFPYLAHLGSTAAASILFSLVQAVPLGLSLYFETACIHKGLGQIIYRSILGCCGPNESTLE